MKKGHESKPHEQPATNRYEVIVNAAREAIIVICRGVICEWNPGAERLFGYTQAEAKGKAIHDLVAPESIRPTANEGLASFESNGRSQIMGKVLVLDAVHKEGHTIPIELSLSPVLLDDELSVVGVARDISERKKMEEQLKVSEERYRSLTVKMKDITYTMDQNGIIEFIGPQVSGYGLDAKEMIGRSFLEFVHPDDRKQLQDEFFRSTTGEDISSTFRVIDQDGTAHWFEETANTHYDATGKYAGGTGVLRDITKRREAEEALKNEKCFSDAIIESIPGMLYVYDEQGKLVRANRNHETMTGYSSEELAQRSALSYYDKGDIARVNEAIAKVFETGYGEVEVPMTIRDGTKLMMHFTGAKLMMNGQKYFVGVGTDISKRKQAEAELRESKELIDAVVENVPLMIFLKEANDLGFVLFNRAGEELTGHNSQTLLGKNDLDIFPPEQAAHFIAKDREVLDGKEGMLDIPEEYMDSANKGRRVLHTRKVCIRGADGQTKYLLGISEDITDHKAREAENAKLQEKIRQAQKMEVVGRLAAGVAHDFNNLLAVILGNADMANADMEKENIDPCSTAYQDISEIKAAGLRAADLTRALLAFSRKQKLDVVPTNLNSVIKQFMPSLCRIAGEDVGIHQELGGDLSSVLADASEIEMITANLVANARDAMPKGGNISLETRNVHFDEKEVPSCEGARPGTFVELCVEDRGTGISPEHLEKIFEPFYTTKDVGKGTGLGLATVYGSVMQQDGFIEVESELGKGTKFKLYFPATAVRAELRDKSESREKLIRGTETIIVAEDEPKVREVISRILQKCGYQVFETDNAGSAYLRLEEQIEAGAKVHMVLTDVRMPIMSGTTLGIKIERQYPDTQVVYMSGYTNLDDDLAGKDFIPKPIQAQELSVRIRQILDAKKTETKK